jgi:hypothetical protein
MFAIDKVAAFRAKGTAYTALVTLRYVNKSHETSQGCYGSLVTVEKLAGDQPEARKH